MRKRRNQPRSLLGLYLRDHPGVSLTAGERLILEKAPTGEPADLSTLDGQPNDPAKAAQWSAERNVSAKLIRWLYCKREAGQHVHEAGVFIQGARLMGDLHFEWATLAKPLATVSCVYSDPIVLQHARTKTLNLAASRFNGLIAPSVHVAGDLVLNEVDNNGLVLLTDSAINGSMYCKGAYFKCGPAMRPEQPNPSFGGDRMKVGGQIVFEGLRADGEVKLHSAHIGGQFNLQNARLNALNDSHRPLSPAFTADLLVVDGNMNGAGLSCIGEFRLFNARIAGQLNLESAAVEAPVVAGEHERIALNLSEIEVKLDAILQHAKVQGTIATVGAKFNGQLNLGGARINELEKGGSAVIPAIHAEAMFVAANAFFDEQFLAIGEVRMSGSRIGGQLTFRSATLRAPGGIALNLIHVTVAMETLLDEDFRAEGQVLLNRAVFSGNLQCTDGIFSNPGGVALEAAGMRVETEWTWRPKEIPKGRVILKDAFARRLNDAVEKWADNGQIDLDGFTYDRFTGDSGHVAVIDAETRLNWLRRQPATPFRPQPYEQLAKVLRTMGDDRGAKEVLIAKHDDMLKHGNLAWATRLWYRIIGFFLGYGWKTHRAFLAAFVVMTLGCSVFQRAVMVDDAIRPSKERVYMDARYEASGYLPPEYPQFNAIVYSVDTFFPFVNLHQEDYWLPNVYRHWGRFYMIYLWLHIGAGWILSTLAVGGLTGLIRKE